MVNQVASALVEESFTEGQYIITQGEEGDKFYVIAEGAVKCTSTKEGGAEIDLITLKVHGHFLLFFCFFFVSFLRERLINARYVINEAGKR